MLHPGLRDDVPGAHVRGRGVPHRQLHLPLHQVLHRIPLRPPGARHRAHTRGGHQEGNQVSQSTLFFYLDLWKILAFIPSV